jgi:uncharacterized damage-inducible protein DinB
VTERERILEELAHAWNGDPWHGSSAADLLKGVDATTAAAHPIPGAHSIWEIVLHMAGWVREAASRLGGRDPGEPAGGDWPEPDDTSARAWTAAVADLGAAHAELRAVVATLEESTLLGPPAGARNRALGTGVNAYRLLHGIAQHDAYHAGQIALLRKFSKRRGGAAP